MKERNSKVVKFFLIGISAAFFLLMLVMPLLEVIYRALADGLESYRTALTADYTLSALKVTLIATLIAVAVNTVFGVIASWLVTKFDFRGKNVLSTLIDIPFSVSPVIAGLAYIMTFGRTGWAKPLIDGINDALGTDIALVFSVPAVVLATIFVSFPFISREIIPVLYAEGRDEEEAAAMMGASGFTIFRKITFPHIKWALVYGVVLCTARAMGEFGAVSVISGHLRGKTNTLPLHVEILYNEFNTTAAFAVSSILVIMAVVILIIRSFIERKRKI